MKINLKKALFMLTGTFLVAFGTYFFLAPNHIAAGGTSGIAIIINAVFPNLPIGLLMMGIK